jgi:methyltransferase (TIGR00027 family)
MVAVRRADRPICVEVPVAGDEQWDIESGIGVTAVAAAAGRAVETSKADALITDPYAARLVDEAHPPVPMPTSIGELRPGHGSDPWPEVFDYVGVRSRAFDEYFGRAVRAGITQVVILASGLDTRAWRLEWPQGTVLFEIDQPAVLEFKLRVLRDSGARPGCDHRPVPGDLREDWAKALVAAGFDRARRTAWLAEGLLPYLSAEVEEGLFDEVHRLSAPGSRLAVEQIDNITNAISDPLMTDSKETIGVDVTDLLQTDPRPPAGERLTSLGWREHSVTVVETAAHYGRSLDPTVGAMGDIMHIFAELP